MNRFKDHILRVTYDMMVQSYRSKDKDLMRSGNPFATNFWRGFDNVTKPEWDRASKKTLAYACWRAGRDMAHHNEE